MGRSPVQLAQQTPGYAAGWYDWTKGEVRLKFWEQGTRKVESFPFRWHFFLRTADLDRIRCRKFEAMVSDLKPDPDGVHTRVFLPPGSKELDLAVHWLRDKGVEPLEADVPPLTRFMSDRRILFDQAPRVLFYDLECDYRGLPWPEMRRWRILSVACRWLDSQETQFFCAPSMDDAGERALLLEFLQEVAQADVLVAWNGDKFDEPMLKARCKKQLAREPEWGMVNFLDQMRLFEKYYRRDDEGTGVKSNLNLDFVARKVLGRAKVGDKELAKDIAGLWMKDRELLARYNCTDVDLQWELEEKLGHIEAHRALSNTCNRFVSSRSIWAGYRNDGFLLAYSSNIGFHWPSRFKADWENEAESEAPEGAFVMEPEPGLHFDVHDLDFSSQYPNVVRSFNISPEVRVGGIMGEHAGAPTCEAWNGAKFRTDQVGIFPTVVTMSMERRQKFKDEARRLEEAGQEGTIEHRRALQTSDAWKEMSNSGFGTFGNKRARYYDRECFEATTVSSKAIVQGTMDEARKLGSRVVYGVTDSVFLKGAREFAEEFAERSGHTIDGWISARGGTPGHIRLKRDASFDRIFWTARNRYAGLKDTGKVDIRGLEIIKSDQCRYARALQQAVVDYVMFSTNPNPTDLDKMVKGWAKRLYRGEMKAADLTLAKKMGKELDDYAGRPPPHVRVARAMAERGEEVWKGMKIPFIVYGRDHNGDDAAVPAADFSGEFDRDHYWRKQVFPPTERVLMAAFPAERRVWKELARWDPKQRQGDMFSLEVDEYGAVRYILTEQHGEDFEAKLTKAKRVFLDNPGTRPALVVVRVPDGDHVFDSGFFVRHGDRVLSALRGIFGSDIGHDVEPEREDSHGSSTGDGV